jgi:hypothetical protein
MYKQYCSLNETVWKQTAQWNIWTYDNEVYKLTYHITNNFMNYSGPSKLLGTLAETKIGRLVYSNSPLGGTVVIRILRFLVALYLLFLTDIEQNRIVRANCYLLSECNMVALHNVKS